MRAAILLLLVTSVAASQTSPALPARYAARLVPMLCEAIAFQTEPGNKAALAAQSKWLQKQAAGFGLTYRDAGPVTEIELPGPPNAPVLGLVVHGDVQPAGNSGWTVPPFGCTEKDGFLYGRGSADDKGPLVQALLVMAALKESGRPRSHTIRLLVGSDEESDNQDVATYLKTHKAPDVSLVLDSEFPVVIGEKAWDALELTAADPYRTRSESGAAWALVDLEAGVTPSIVPPSATARLRRVSQSHAPLCPSKVPEGYGCQTRTVDGDVVISITGRAAHSGMNIGGGRNALVLLAKTLRGKLAASEATDLLEFASIAGADLYGSGLGLPAKDPVWGNFFVNVAMAKPADGGKLKLTINIRRNPPMTALQIRQHLVSRVAEFNRQRKSALEVGGYFRDEPFFFSPDSALVKRLLAVYERSTGEKARPAIAGGGTYARRLPNAVAFGMWFPDKPYPGHDVDERIPIVDLHRGASILLSALDALQ